MEVNAGSTALPWPLQPLEVERGAKKIYGDCRDGWRSALDI